MRSDKKMLGAITASILGSLIFLAPDSMTSDRLTSGNILGQPANAQPSNAKTAAAKMRMDARVTELRVDDDNPITASIPGNIDPVARHLVKVKAAYDDYLDAVIAIEDSGHNPEDQAKMKAADDRYFNAVIALESAKLQAAEQKWYAAIEQDAAEQKWYAAIEQDAAEQKWYASIEQDAAEQKSYAALKQKSHDNLTTASIPAKASMAKKATFPAKRNVAKKPRHVHRRIAKVDRENSHGPLGGLINIMVKGFIWHR